MSNVNYKTGTGFLLATLGRKSESLWNAFLKEQAMTTAQFTALSVLYKRRSCIQKLLAEEIEVDPRNMVATVNKLRAKGWVAYSNDVRDGRAKVISITAAGNTIIEYLYAHLKPIDKVFFKNITAEEREQLGRILVKLKL